MGATAATQDRRHDSGPYDPHGAHPFARRAVVSTVSGTRTRHMTAPFETPSLRCNSEARSTRFFTHPAPRGGTDTKQARRPLTPNRIRRCMRLSAAPERGRQAAQDRAQPGALRRARAGPQAAGAGLDRREGHPVAAHRPSTVTGDGMDTDPDRRLSRRGRRRPALGAVAPALLPRTATVRGGLAVLGRRRPRPRPRSATVRAGSQRDWDGPKSEAGERSVALDPGTVAVLRRHRKAQQELRLLWGAAWTETAWSSPMRTAGL